MQNNSKLASRRKMGPVLDACPYLYGSYGLRASNQGYEQKLRVDYETVSYGLDSGNHNIYWATLGLTYQCPM